MTDETKTLSALPEGDAEPAADELRSTGNYTVGYKRPPVASRFKPGKSGNPRGRPRGSRNFETVLNDLLCKQYVINEGGKVRRVKGDEFLALTQFNKAVKGDQKSIDRFIAAQNSQARRHVTKVDFSGMSAQEASRAYQLLIKGEE